MVKVKVYVNSGIVTTANIGEEPKKECWGEVTIKASELFKYAGHIVTINAEVIDDHGLEPSTKLKRTKKRK